MDAIKRFWDSLHPKVIASTVGSLIASAVVGALGFLQTNPERLAGLPPWATVTITILLPTAIVFISGYVRSGPETPVALESTPTTVALAPPVIPNV